MFNFFLQRLFLHQYVKRVDILCFLKLHNLMLNKFNKKFGFHRQFDNI